MKNTQKKSSLFSRPESSSQRSCSGQNLYPTPDTEMADFVRQGNGVTDYKLCFSSSAEAITGLTGVNPGYFRGKHIEGLCSVSHIVGQLMVDKVDLL